MTGAGRQRRARFLSPDRRWITRNAMHVVTGLLPG